MGQGVQRERIREGEREGKGRDGNQSEQRGHLLFIEAVSGMKSLVYVEKSSKQMGQMQY